MAFSPGENVGPYRIVNQLGQGGMASVFKAYHAALDRYVALKVLHPAFLEDPNFLARFQREARVVAKLDHPNIVPIYDFAEHDGHPYLVMKYIEGRTLKAVMAGQQLSDDQKLAIIQAIGQAMEYAHARGVLHRDIKPSNVLLSDDGGIYLADFGLARIAQAGESTLSSDMLMGTPQYISPEQARGEKELDEGTDIYSFGVVIYEMMVGRVPFNADTPFSIVHDHIYTPLPMPREVNPSVPERVERVLLKALAKERGDRFKSVSELVEAFHGALVEKQDTVPLATLPPATVDELSLSPEEAAEEPKARSRRWLWIVGGLVLSCLCLFAFLAIAGNLDDRNQAEAATATALAQQANDEPVATPVPTAVVDDPQVVDLRRQLAQDPGNPELRSQLAMALVEAGYPELSIRHWREAGDIYMAEGAYAEAARAYNEAVNAAGGLAAAEAPLRESMTEALFKAASSPRLIRPMLERLEQNLPNAEPLLPIIARAAIYEGQLEAAVAELERASSQSTDPLLYAVLAEAYSFQGQTERAANMAQRVLSSPESPDWLIEHTEQLIEQIESS